MLAEDLKLKFFLYTAIFLTLTGYAGSFAGVEPLHSQFFAFAVWAYILFIDNLNYRFGGSSLAVSRTAEFLALALGSLAIGCVLELLNLWLGAWHYTNQPATLSTRWTGMALARASFLPSLFVTAELLRTFGLFTGLKTRALPVTPRFLGIFSYTGAALLSLALGAPKLFHPLIWAALFFLAEPLNYRLGLPSLLREWEGGLPGKTLRLALAGVICGLLWNAWNGYAGAQWVYTFPRLGPEAFGLPLIAFAGFALFSLQAYSLYSLASALREGRTWEEGAWLMPGAGPGPRVRYAAAAIIIITSYIAFRAVDARSITLYIGWI